MLQECREDTGAGVHPEGPMEKSAFGLDGKRVELGGSK